MLHDATVLDAGNSRMRAGFSGCDAPHSVFDLVVGIPRPMCCGGPGTSGDEVKYIGDEVFKQRRKICRTIRPMKDGVVTQWDYMEKVWHHTFYNELRRAPEDHRLMMSHSPCATDIETDHVRDLQRTAIQFCKRGCAFAAPKRVLHRCVSAPRGDDAVLRSRAGCVPRPTRVILQSPRVQRCLYRTEAVVGCRAEK